MKKYLIALSAFIVLTVFVVFRIHQAQAVITVGQPGNYPVPYLVTHDLFASSSTATNFGTTTAATSTNIVSYFDQFGRLDTGAVNVAGSRKVSWYFTLVSTSTPSSSATTTFTVQVSPDGINWYNWNKLTQNVASSTNQTEIASVALSNSLIQGVSTSTAIIGMDMTYDGLDAVRCIVNWGAITNGTAYCRASVTY